MQAYGFSGPMSGLPDPEIDRQFYDSVPSRRLVAWLVDLIVVLGIGVPVAVLFGLVTLGIGFMAFPLVLMAVSFLYRTATISGRSATWGMRFTGIELRRHDGTRFDLATAAMHVAIYLACVAVFPLLIVSCLAIVGTRYHQGISDIILRSAAINSPAD